MLPTLAAGEFVLVDPSRAPRIGDLVVAKHPSKPIEILKRVAAMDRENQLHLLSDNHEIGSDSRHFGPINADGVVGVVTLCLSSPSRSLQKDTNLDR